MRHRRNCRSHERLDLDVADIAEVWRRGSVITSWLLDLDRRSALARDPGARHILRPRFGFGRRPLDGRGRDRARRAGRGSDLRVVYALPVEAGSHFCGEDPLRDAQRLRRTCRAEEMIVRCCCKAVDFSTFQAGSSLSMGSDANLKTLGSFLNSPAAPIHGELR